MAPKKKKMPAPKRTANIAAEIENAGVVMEQPITQTLETNFMPYAMSVIISRAIPEIDGFKPAHRKLLYTMYKMGLLTGARTKSANIVGQTILGAQSEEDWRTIIETELAALQAK